MGMLFASGWRMDDVLDLSWDQISVVVSCVISYKVEQANIISDTLTTALGGKVERRGQKRKTPDREKQKAKREKALVGMFAKHGFSV